MYNILFVAWLLAWCIQWVYWLVVFRRVAHWQPVRIGNQSATPVSVVLCARNEAANLRKNLITLLIQNYQAAWEVLVIDDASTDDTPQVLAALQQIYPHLRVERVTQKNNVGKKAALEFGIKSARYDWVLLTDADCAPVSNAWISNMMCCIENENVQIVLGYSPYQRQAGWLNRFIRYETIYTAMQYGAWAMMGLPYMGVGRNLLYQKELFINNSNFNAHRHLASGDDDLFINRVATASNTRLCLLPETWVVSEPKNTWRGWYRQKTRHYSTGTYYRPVHQLILGAWSASLLWTWGLGGLLLWSDWWQWVAIGMLTRSALVCWVMWKNTEQLGEKDLRWFVWLFDFFVAIYYLIFVPALFFRTNRNLWK